MHAVMDGYNVEPSWPSECCSNFDINTLLLALYQLNVKGFAKTITPLSSVDC